MDLRPVPGPRDSRRARGERSGSRPRDPADLEEARDLLARTIRFLTLCQEDPRAATAKDDPTELVEALEKLELRHREPTPASSPDAELERRRDSA